MSSLVHLGRPAAHRALLEAPRMPASDEMLGKATTVADGVVRFPPTPPDAVPLVDRSGRLHGLITLRHFAGAVEGSGLRR